MPEVLTTKKREPHGKRASRRLRREGLVPVNLYGHGQQNVYLSVAVDQVKSAIRHGARVIELTGAVEEKAFIRELQWDTYGVNVLHLDLTRVSADERLEVTVTIELKGQAPGIKEGGVVEHVTHEIDIECPATEVSEKLIVSVSDLHLDGEIRAGSLELPPGAKLLSSPDDVIVHCVKPRVMEEEGAAATAESAEPELIRKPAEEEEGAEE